MIFVFFPKANYMATLTIIGRQGSVMFRFLFLVLVCYVSSPNARAITSKIAGFTNLFPSFGYTHPVLSSHIRNSLGLRYMVSNTTALEVLKHTGPETESCAIRLNSILMGRSGVKHKQFNIICHELPVFGGFLAEHDTAKGSVLISGQVPEKHSEFLAAEALVSEQEAREQMILYDFTDTPAAGQLIYFFHPDKNAFLPSYQFTAYKENHGRYTVIIDGIDGDFVTALPQFFNAHKGYTFLENSFEEKVQLRELTSLQSTANFLDGNNFQVFGSTLQDERAQADEKMFSYFPEDEKLFDQVQTYYSLERAKTFFNQHFTDLKTSAIEVYTHSSLDNNAMYLPGDTNNSDAIYIGTSDDVYMTNLNRDSDVVIHEYSHHIIYHFLQATYGESLILHEGTADFFAYVINNNPNLAESLLPGSGYLRTANLDHKRLYDDEKEYLGAHLLGQFWSAFLWDLYQELGPMVITTITKSLYYWNKKMTLSDAFLALLHADDDINAGKNHCTILKTAQNRGFFSDTRSMGDNSCGLIYSQTPPPLDEQKKETIACGAIGIDTQSANFLWLLLSPLLLLVGRGHED